MVIPKALGFSVMIAFGCLLKTPIKAQQTGSDWDTINALGVNAQRYGITNAFIVDNIDAWPGKSDTASLRAMQIGSSAPANILWLDAVDAKSNEKTPDGRVARWQDKSGKAALDSKPGTPVRAHHIPGFWAVHDVRGGTDATNNAKVNHGGGYLSHIDHIRQYQYPGGHGNTWGDTALVNDWNVWDKPGFHWDQKFPTASPIWDALSDHSTAWLETGEWLGYDVSVAKAGVYMVTLRMASGQGPDPLPPGQTRHQVRIDVDGKDATGPMPVLWTGKGAYPADPSPKFNKGPYGWSWIHHFFDVRSPGIKLTAGVHVLRVFMVAGQRGETWIEHITVVRPGDPLPVAAPRVKSTLLGEAPTGEAVRGLSELKAGTHWQGGSTPDDIGSLMDGNPWTQIALADTKNFQQSGDFVSARVTNAALGYSHIRLFAPPETKDFPQHWAVQTSPDGLAWSKNIASGVGAPNVTDIRFPLQTGPDVQYVRVILTETALGWWRIGEFQVFGPLKAADAATAASPWIRSTATGRGAAACANVSIF